MVNFKEEFYFPYYVPGMTEAGLDNVLVYFLQETTAPARLAGEVLLVQETLDQTKDARRAWIYNPGQRRVRRAPKVAFDNPGTNSDNQRTDDQFDMYNGSPERYDWKLVGKKEIYVPYNAYQLQSEKIKYADLLHKNHINQDYARYELHRVWVVDATLKPGFSHIYSAPHAVRRRGLLADPRGGLLRQPRAAVARAGRPRDQLLRPADAVDRRSSWSWTCPTGATWPSACRTRSRARTTSASSAPRRITNRACWSGAECARPAERACSRRCAGCSLLPCSARAPAAAQARRGAARRPSRARLAAHALLIALAAAGERLVAVGDRGVIVYSDDRGTSWDAVTRGADPGAADRACASSTPSTASRSATTSWCSPPPMPAAAGGCAHYDPAAQRPLLDVWCGSDGHAIAVGAYSTYLTSEDAGASWQERPFHPVPRARARPGRGQGPARRRRCGHRRRGLSPEPHRRRRRRTSVHRRRSRTPVPLRRTAGRSGAN